VRAIEQTELFERVTDRIVCWFSCGAASAVATKLAIEENNRGAKLPIVVVRCVVREEHEDNDRFAADCEKWFGLPIVNLINEKYDGSIYEVFRIESYISGVSGAPCTRLLKKEVRIRMQQFGDRHVMGYCAEEQDRWDDFLDANNIDAVAPLIERGLRHSNCLSMVEAAGIKLPAMYLLGYKHNNCIGCAKSNGQGYWNKIRNDFPLQFVRMATESRRLGVRMIIAGKDEDGKNKRIFLDELQPGTGYYPDEPEIQCGAFCEMAKREIGA
jgi:3'-phosphoadenosine 5'-phosphosulfate sulfotransferase (PAPS reductase)/FAD synthetase